MIAEHEMSLLAVHGSTGVIHERQTMLMLIQQLDNTTELLADAQRIIAHQAETIDRLSTTVAEKPEAVA